MTTKEHGAHFSVRPSIFLVGLVALIALLKYASSILIPLVFAVIIAIVLHPVVSFLVRRKVNRLLAIIIVLFLTFAVLFAFSLLLFSQISRFSDSLPILIDRFTEVLHESVLWISGYFDIDPVKVNSWITASKTDLVNNSSNAIGQTLITIGSGVVVIFLLPVYIFLLLFYHPLLMEFIHRLFSKSHQKQVNEIITQIKTVIQRYLVGLVIEAFIISSMYTTALLILGIDYAILLGIIGALLNLIPYVGGLVGVALPMMVALATKTSFWPAIYILIVYYIIQLIDNNYIVPKIVASKVKINALVSIIVVIVGNAIWGIPGMFLSLPLIAIVKLIFDNIESLQPLGFLLGDTMPPVLKLKALIKRKKQ